MTTQKKTNTNSEHCNCVDCCCGDPECPGEDELKMSCEDEE